MYEDTYDITPLAEHIHSFVPDVEPATPLESVAKRMGGKARLRTWLVQQFPKDIVTYVEPFTGSAKVLLWKPRRDRIEIINDLDADLIHFFRYVTHDPDRLVDLINATPLHEAIMLGFRYDLADQRLTGLQRAAAFWFSMQTTFNAKTGKHHMYASSPYAKLSIGADKGHFRKVSKRLQGVDIRSTSVWRILQSTVKPVRGPSGSEWNGVFFYLDPPYDETAGYESHAAGDSVFGKREQKMLRDWCVKINESRNRFIQTNSDTKYLRKIYGEIKNSDGTPAFYFKTVDVYYSVGSKDRGTAKELVISNFPLEVQSKPQVRMF